MPEAEPGRNFFFLTGKCFYGRNGHMGKILLPPRIIKRILATLDGSPIRVMIAAGQSPTRLREALNQHFYRHHSELSLHARILPHGLMCWVTKRHVVMET